MSALHTTVEPRESCNLKRQRPCQARSSTLPAESLRRRRSVRLCEEFARSRGEKAAANNHLDSAATTDPPRNCACESTDLVAIEALGLLLAACYLLLATCGLLRRCPCG